MSLFSNETAKLQNVVVQPTATGDVALTVKAQESGQSAKLVSVQNSAGTEVASVDKSGNLALAATDALQINSVKVPTSIPVVFQAPIATAAVSQTIFTADAAYQVTAVREVHGTASSSGTVTVEKLTGTTAPGSGTAMLTGTISTAGTANTVLSGTLTGTAGTLQLAAGDRIGLVSGGSQTSLVGMNVVVSLKRI